LLSEEWRKEEPMITIENELKWKRGGKRDCVMDAKRRRISVEEVGNEEWY
jgi:hypothetical protein